MRLTYLENRHNVFNTPWTPERDEILKELWAQGYSASQIANKFNGSAITRCAVIGRVHRLKLPARKPRDPGPPYLRKRRKRANGVPKPPAPPPRPKPPPPPPPSLTKMRRLTFAKLKPSQCKWPVDPPVDDLAQPARLFCAADTKGEVYCPFHQRIARPGK